MKRRSQPKVGRAPSPYAKYKKRAYQYSPQYYAWRNQFVSRQGATHGQKH